MTYDALDAFLKEHDIHFSVDLPMKEYTTFRIGGKVDRIVFPSSSDELSMTIEYCKKNAVPYIVIGNGSNLLISDDGIRGVVIQLGERFSTIRTTDKKMLICEAGALLSKVCVTACNESLHGLEFAYGIPGTVGGAAYMNAGAYGGELKDVVLWCEVIDQNGHITRKTNAECEFAYRSSSFKKNEEIVVRVCFALEKGDQEAIREQMETLMGKRKEKQPLQFPSAGSTFKRPVGGFASALIDEAGLKGVSVGGAQVSEKHAGFVINTGNATCRDVIDLMKLIHDTVLERSGISLEPEVVMLPQKKGGCEWNL